MASKRKQVYLAVVGSVGIHLLVLFAWAFTVQWFPNADAASDRPPEQISVEIVQDTPAETPPPPEPDTVASPTPKARLSFKDNDNSPDAHEPPKNAAFQSDRNTEAASELPATGDKPLPTQKGKAIPSFAFDSHPYVEGEAGSAAGQDVPANMPPLLATAPPLPSAVPKPPEPSPPPAPTPAASVADPRDLAMVTPKSLPATPIEAEPNPYDPSFRPPVGMTEPPRPTPVPRSGGYRPLREKAAISGGIGKPGASAVATEDSPAGRYITSVQRAMESRYHQYVDARADIISFGNVKVHIRVDRDGKVRGARVVSNDANEGLAAVCLRAVSEAKLTPMSPEAAAFFEGGILDMFIVFTLE